MVFMLRSAPAAFAPVPSSSVKLTPGATGVADGAGHILVGGVARDVAAEIHAGGRDVAGAGDRGLHGQAAGPCRGHDLAGGQRRRGDGHCGGEQAVVAEQGHWKSTNG